MNRVRFFIISLLTLVCVQTQILHADWNLNDDDFDFDLLDQAMTQAGLDDKIEIEEPSRVMLIIRQIADPIMIHVFRTVDYIREKIRFITAILKKKIDELKRAKKYELASK